MMDKKTISLVLYPKLRSGDAPILEMITSRQSEIALSGREATMQATMMSLLLELSQWRQLNPNHNPLLLDPTTPMTLQLVDSVITARLVQLTDFIRDTTDDLKANLKSINVGAPTVNVASIIEQVHEASTYTQQLLKEIQETDGW